MREQYVDAICREIELKRDYLQGDEVGTIYFGGGTPSQLEANQIGWILKKIKETHFVTDNPEITVEINPDDVTDDYVARLKETTTNRVSLGVQSFNDEILKFINRRHSAQQAIDAVYRLQEEGFSNISVDLMFGFPGETIEEWQNDIEKALQLNVQHLSAYSLMYEEGTKLYQLLENKQIEEIDDELSLLMYQILTERLTEAGFEHYEISNFARMGFRSQHNSGYWDGTKYLGLGAGAHSYDGKQRKHNVSNLKKYIEGVNTGQLNEETETLTTEEQYNEVVMTGLRTAKGIDEHVITERFGKSYLDHLEECATPYYNMGLLEKKGGRIVLTKKGIYTSNEVIAGLFR